nr:MAG TPA: hypothetical protein [Caudoviricetes sp.]
MASISPERSVIKALKDSGVSAYTELPDLSRTQVSAPTDFALVVRTSMSRQSDDVNRNMVERSYRFLITCFSSKGLESASVLSDKVAEVIDDLYYTEDLVSDAETTSGSEIPPMGKYSCFQLGITITYTE